MFFKDIIGHQDIKSNLLQLCDEGRVGHAYLFSGIEGVGTFPMALAFAQYLNCLNPANGDSCGVCSSCIKASKLIHPDIHFVFPVVKDTKTVVSDDFIAPWRNMVLESPYFSYDRWISMITDSKKSGVIYSDESASIMKKLNMKNFEGKYKIMIIWLPERMNVEGANKILKILEEPPLSTVFLFVSDNPGILLTTILSRLQRVDFLSIDDADISKFLVAKYHCDVDDAKNIAKISKGSIVSAIEAFETKDESTFYFDSFADMMRTCYSRKIFDVMRLVDDLSPLSRDKLKGFFDYSINMLRESFVFNMNDENLNFLNKAERGFVEKFARFINYENALAMVGELELAYAHIEQNGNAKIILFDMMIKIIPLFKV